MNYTVRMYLGKDGSDAAAKIGMRVENNGGHNYVEIPSLTWVAVPELAGMEEFFTLRELITTDHKLVNSRYPGIYIENSTRADLSLRNHYGRCLEISIEAKTLEDLRAMYEKIIGGTILPTYSLAIPQTGPSYRELKAENEELKNILAEQKAQIIWLRARVDAILKFLQSIANKLSGSFLSSWINQKLITHIGLNTRAFAFDDATLILHKGVETEPPKV